jgi:hypothetical protein
VWGPGAGRVSADAQAAAYAAYDGVTARAELERSFFLDDADREMVEGSGGLHTILRSASAATSVKYARNNGSSPCGTRNAGEVLYQKAAWSVP